MAPGDLVTYLARPDWGPGVIEFVAPNGLVTVSFELDGRPFRDDFSAHEIELAARAQAAA